MCGFSLRGPPAIDDDTRSRSELRLVAREEHDRLGDVGGLAEAAQGNGLAYPLRERHDRRNDAGVVDEYVEGAEALGSQLDRALPVGFPPDVAAGEQDPLLSARSEPRAQRLAAIGVDVGR